MTDPISHRNATAHAATRATLEKAERKINPKGADKHEAPAAPVAGSADKGVNLSNVLDRVKAQPDFDRVKVDAIKAAIKDGHYPVHARRIAESFVSIENMLHD